MAEVFRYCYPPSLAELEQLAHEALDFIPPELRQYCSELIIQVTDFAADEILQDLDIEDPYELTGLYQGVSLMDKGIDTSGMLPDMVFLYRMPILLEWIETGEDLRRLVRQVMVHEIGHHFGFSDEAMEALEKIADAQATKGY